MTDQTTARAQRAAAVRDGSEADAVDRRVSDANPRGSDPERTTRNRQRATRRDVADEVDVDREGVGAVDRIGQGIDVFLRSVGVRQFGERVQDDFASEADFVESDDVAPRVDGQRIAASPQVARDRRPTVADRARQETAADMEFIEGDDLDAQVGAFGVEDIGVRDERRPQIQDRAAAGLASEDPFAEPDDFEVQVGERGIEAAGLTDDGALRRAGRQFESETPLTAVDPARDIQPVDDGFGLTSVAERRLTAREFEGQFDMFGSGELDPETDIRDTNGGFGLAREPARQVAAADIDRQLDSVDVSPDDITLEDTDDGGFEAVFETEVRR